MSKQSGLLTLTQDVLTVGAKAMTPLTTPNKREYSCRGTLPRPLRALYIRVL
jgi:hypothetical protein